MKEVPEKFLQALRLVAPGTVIREGLDNILRGHTGALIVIGDAPEIREIAEGGFELNAELTATGLYELSKMDGAILVSGDGRRILKANVHLIPQAAIPSQETGIRHRTAERVARQTGAIVIAISQRRSIITLYQGAFKYVVRDTGLILARANEALQALEKYRRVLEKFLGSLTVMEFEEAATAHDVVKVIQRIEMIGRVMDEIDFYVIQLGNESRLVTLQLEEMVGGLKEEGDLVIRDYWVASGDRTVEQVHKQLNQCSPEEILEPLVVSRILGFGGNLAALDQPVVPRGYRILRKIPRLPMAVIENLVSTFSSLPRILEATVEALDAVDGIGEVRARAIKEGLAKLREQVILEHYS